MNGEQVLDKPLCFHYLDYHDPSMERIRFVIEERIKEIKDECRLNGTVMTDTEMYEQAKQEVDDYLLQPHVDSKTVAKTQPYSRKLYRKILGNRVRKLEQRVSVLEDDIAKLMENLEQIQKGM